MGAADLQQRDYIIDGISGIDLVQEDELEDGNLVLNIGGKMMEVTPDDSTLTQLNNPVDNPPYNNWSVNQPSPPHDVGLYGKEDLGMRDLTIDGINGYDLT